MLRSFVTVSVATTAAMLSAPALADSRSASVSALVPETCRFVAPALTLDPDRLSALGMAWEACNSMRGYRIAANTRALNPDETVTIAYGASLMQLDLSGRTMLMNRRGPSLRQVPIELTANALQSPLTISMTMTVI